MNREALVDALSAHPFSPSRAEAAAKTLLAAGPLPAALRLSSWRALFGVPASLDEAEESHFVTSVAATVAIPNARVVQRDAARTRAELPAFRAAGVEARVARLCTFYAAGGYVARTAAELASSLSSLPPPVQYKQGLNEIVAAVLLAAPGAAGGAEGGDLEAGLSDGLAMAVLSRLLAVYAPRLYGALPDPELLSLQCALQLFRLVLQYHDPGLAQFLESFGCTPELYCTSWLFTLMLRGNTPEVCLALIDFYAASSRVPGSPVLFCLAVSFLCSHRAAILATATQGTSSAELPGTLSKLAFADVVHVRAVCGAALSLLRALPLSLRQLLAGVCGGGAPASATLQGALEAQLCVRIPVWELLAGSGLKNVGLPPPRVAAGGGGGGGGSGGGGAPPPADADGWRLLELDDAAWATAPRYIMLDLRSAAELERGGRLPTGFHVDPAWLGPAGDAEKLFALLEGFSGLRASGVHFSVCGRGDLNCWYHAPFPPPGVAAGAAGGDEDAEALLLLEKEEDEAGRALALLLIQKGFPHVSHVVGGFTALHQCQAHYLSDVLVGHDPALCLVCTGGRSELAAAGGGRGPAEAPPAHAQQQQHRLNPIDAASTWLADSMSRLLHSPSEDPPSSRRSPSPAPTPTLPLAEFLKGTPVHPAASSGGSSIGAQPSSLGGGARSGRAPSETNVLDDELDAVAAKRGFAGFSKAIGNSLKSPPPARLRALSSSLLQALDSALLPPPPGRGTPKP